MITQPLGRRLAVGSILAGLAATGLFATAAPAQAASPSLAAGQTLSAPATLTSPDGFVTAAVQADGNFVIYAGGGAIWQSWTAGTANTNPHLAMQTDGNLVLYSQANTPLWNLGTRNSGATKVTLQDDGNLVATNAAGQPVGSTDTTAASLLGGNTLKPGQSLFSPTRLTHLVMQDDGNLVLYQGTGPTSPALWQSKTDGDPGAYLAMQTDGNLVVYSASNTPLWQLGTRGNGGTRITLQDDGNIVEFTASAQPVADFHITANTLVAGQTLQPGQTLTSSDHSTRLAMQTDGNAVLYGPANQLLWQSNTRGYPSARLTLQTDGNLVIYQGATPLWANGKNNTGTTNRLAVESDHNLVEYSGATQVWSSGTGIAAGNCWYVSGAAPGPVSAAGVTLGQQQATNAMAVVAAGRQIGMSQRDQAIAVMTAFTESSIRRLANPAVPDSYYYPYDGVGYDHYSVGLFQQQNGWGPTQNRMDAAGSARLFYNVLRTITNRDQLTMGQAAQAVQISAYPDRYQVWADFATQLVQQWAGQPQLPATVSCN